MDVFFFPEDFVPEDFILIRAPTMGSTGYSGWNNFQVWTFLKFWSWVPPGSAPTTPSTWLNSFQWMDGFFFFNFPRGLCPRGLYPDQGINHGIHRLQWLEYFSGLDIFKILKLGASWQSTNHAFNLVELHPMDGCFFLYFFSIFPEDFILIRVPPM